jgi:hypothetical protein
VRDFMRDRAPRQLVNVVVVNVVGD